MPEQYIWIGTNGGLNRLHKKTGRATHYTTHNSEIPNNVIYQIQADNHGRLWLSTNMGLSRFDSQTGLFKNFTTEDGLQNMEFNTNSSLKLPAGHLLFGGIKGLNVPHGAIRLRWVNLKHLIKITIVERPVPANRDQLLAHH